jgi:pantetheine-phosphate adenylyltransferase
MTDKLNPRFAAYVGSFDPLTLGHQDIIRRGAGIFDRLIVGIGINPDKQPLFMPQERVDLTTRVLSSLSNVEVHSFRGLAVDFVRARGCGVMLRGVRTLTDIDAEFTMSLANSVLAPDIETVFLMSGERYSHISSTLIKQIAQMSRAGSAEKLRDFVPQEIIEPLMSKVGH